MLTYLLITDVYSEKHNEIVLLQKLNILQNQTNYNLQNPVQIIAFLDFKKSLLPKIKVPFLVIAILSFIIIFKFTKMNQQIEQHFTLFTKQSKQALFDILSSNVKFNEKPFTEQDFKVDLVMRLKVPTQAIMPKDYEITIQKLFKNIPTEYEEIYQEALEYVYYLTATDPNSKLSNLPETTITTRCMTSLKSLMRPQQRKKKYLDNRMDEEEVIIDCQYQYLPFLDTFTVFYNMIMVILERVCGFHVRTFLMENNEDSGFENTNVVYLLLSQSNKNLVKMADKVELKKQMDMRDIDFKINDPSDKKGRPIKYHSYFKSQPDFSQFIYNQKMLCRPLGIKQMSLQHDICGEADLNEKDAAKYKEYFNQLIDELINLHRTNQISISHWEKSFLFDFNRQKLNEGCLMLYYQKQLKRLFYEKVKELNQKYGYPYYQYSYSYFEFRMLSRSKPFFQKLNHMLAYKNYTVTRSGQMSLFSKLQRIKLSYLNVERYFKLQSFANYGLDIYALHDNFQKFGDLTYEDNNAWRDYQEGQPQEAKIVTLQSAWKPILPFRCDIKKIRDYMGEKLAFEVMIKIYLTTFFLIVSPISIASQFYLEVVYQHNVTYKYCLLVLLVMVISLNLFIAIWTKAEERFFDNFASTSKQKAFRDGYKGPYCRNLTNDDPNSHLEERTLKQRFLSGVCYIILFTILVLEGVFFWGMRFAIVYTYSALDIIQWRYASVPHLIFYGTYFIVNQFLYYVLFVRVIEFMARWQQFPTLQSHQKVARSYKVFLSFGIQLMAPLFFYIIQPLQGVSCYAAECTDQFSMFIFSRYEILFINILIKFYKCFWVMFGGFINKVVRDEDARITQYLSFEGRLNYLLSYVRSEYKKEEKVQDLRTESLGLVYYVIFKISFPTTTVFTFLMLQFEYIFERLQHFSSNRRPIPIANTMFRLEGTFRNVLHLCILFNAWAITFSLEFVEYDFSDYLESFVLNITADNILSLKLFVTVFIFICFEIISFAFGAFFSSLMYDPLQQRKKMMYTKYLNKIRSKPLKVKLPDLTPLKTMFRTFTNDGIMQHKKNKYKAYENMKKAMLKYQKLSLFQTTNEIPVHLSSQSMESNDRIARA